MKVTFGICVSPTHNSKYLKSLILSLNSQLWNNDDAYQILLVGENLSDYASLKNVDILEFDESIKNAWITKKKNLIGQAAEFDNIVLVHDYYRFPLNWKTANEQINNWEILMNPIFNYEGTRHADWVVNPNRIDDFLKVNPTMADVLMRAAPHENAPRYVSGLPYSVEDLSHIQYISGGYVFLKRNVLQLVPMNESLTWGQAEDVEWSERLNRHGIKFKINIMTSVNIQKPAKWVVSQMPNMVVDALRKFYKQKNGWQNNVQ